MTSRQRQLLIALAGAGALAGLVVRIVLLRTSAGSLDSDEAIVGLMARHFQNGEWRAFFWGQPYGGTIEPAVTAALFSIVGASATALKVVPMAFDALAAVLVWRVARRLIPEPQAIAAGVLVWIWPANYVWWSIKSRGFYEVTLCLSLLGALLVLRICQQQGNHWEEWAALGVVAGLGWWQTPQIVYVLGPAGVWLLWRVRVAAWRAVAGIPGALIGAAPWLVANVGHGFPSLSPPSAAVKGTYFDHLLTFAKEGLPMTLGLKVIYSARFVGPAALGIAVLAAALAVIGFGCSRLRGDGVLVAGIIVLYPFLNSLLTLSGSVSEGRYTLLLMPWLAIAIGAAIARPLIGAAVFAVAMALTVGGIVDIYGQTSPYASGKRVPTSFTALERVLAQHGVDRVWANYWIANVLTFDTGERVIAAPTTSGRYFPYNVAVARSLRIGHVFLAGTSADAAFAAGLRARQIQTEHWDAGPWSVYVPRRVVQPTAIRGAFP